MTLAKYYVPLKRLFEIMRVYKLNGNNIWPWKALELAYQSSEQVDLDSSELIWDTFFDTVIDTHMKIVYTTQFSSYKFVCNTDMCKMSNDSLLID